MPPNDFPHDDNGDALRNMSASGDDLSKSRIINFSIIFNSIESANDFAKAAKQLGIDANIDIDSPNCDSIDVTIKRKKIPTHQNISVFEATLEKLAHPLGGVNDGWGCFSI